MEKELQELCGFLDSEREDLRIAAALATADYSGTAEGTSILARCGDALLRPLINLLRTEDEGASHAAAALVNISQQPASRSQLIALGAVQFTIKAICKSTSLPSAVGRCCMLLANLTQFEDARDQLLVSPLLPNLLDRYSNLHTERHFAHMPLVLTHLLATSGGRRCVLEHPSAVPALMKQFTAAANTGCSSDSDQNVGDDRRSIAFALRNLCFEAATSAPSRTLLLERLALLVAPMVAPLSPPSTTFTDDEAASFPSELRTALGSAGTYAADDELRLALSEALLCLTTAADATAFIKELAIYPILREAQMQEENTHVLEVNEKLIKGLFWTGAAVTPSSNQDESQVEEVPD